MTDTELRELIEQLESPHYAGSTGEDLMLQAAEAISTLIKRRDELEEALRIIDADDYDPIGEHESFTEAAAQIARAALSGAIDP